MDTALMHPREQIVMIIRRIYIGGLTTTSGGNVSIYDENGDIWVTPSAIDKGSLRESDIMQVKKNGEMIGRHKPSSELPFHRAIYESRPDIRAIIHAHPPALVSFSIIHEIPDTNIIPQAKFICGSIGYANYDLPGSDQLGSRISIEFTKGHKAVIMENHGTVVGGSDLKDAYIRFETLEFCARTIINANTIGKPRFLTDSMIGDFESQIPHDLPEFDLATHTSDERQIRADICSIVRRAADQGLMRSTYGTVSVRWRRNDFLITPTNVPRWDLDMEDVVLIKDGKRETGKIPSRSILLHQQIFEKHPEINVIILTQPPGIMAFGVTDADYDVRTIPESWIFLQDVPKVPFGSQFFGKDIIPNLLSKNIPAVIIENDSILVTGQNILQTFDRLEVAEFSARSLIMAAPIGKLLPIKDIQIEDLRKKFLN